MRDEARAADNWPPREGHVVSYKSGDSSKTGVLKEVRWGLVWRDFVLDDGRVIPEVRIQGCPHPQPWRETSDVTSGELEVWEERLATMAAAGLDPREREQSFRAELNQYLAYTYLRFKRISEGAAQAEPKRDDLRERIQEAKRAVTGRLEELLTIQSDAKERDAVAHSLGRLKDLETSLFAFSRPLPNGSTG